MKRVLAIAIISMLVLSACSSTPQVAEPNSPEASAVVNKNEWVVACDNFQSSSTDGYGAAYNEVILDLCSKANPDTYDVPNEVAPSVSSANASRYLDSERFHESYWATRMEPGFPKKMRLIFSELDGDWWEQKQKEHLLEPDLGWFTSKTEQGHCRVEPDIFCPKQFSPNETKDGDPIEFRIIGSQLNWQDWQQINGAHEAVHTYQDSHSQNFWSFWYIEGQATFFELAMARLMFNSDSLRKGFLIDNPQRQDSLKFNAKTPEAAAKYFDDCNNSGNACESFKYGGGSLFHEKLVLDYGLKKYFEWQDWLNSNMPRGNMSKFTPLETEELYKTFAESFEAIFGLTQEHFETRVMPQYFLDSYRALSN